MKKSRGYLFDKLNKQIGWTAHYNVQNLRRRVYAETKMFLLFICVIILVICFFLSREGDLISKETFIQKVVGSFPSASVVEALGFIPHDCDEIYYIGGEMDWAREALVLPPTEPTRTRDVPVTVVIRRNGEREVILNPYFHYKRWYMGKVLRLLLLK